MTSPLPANSQTAGLRDYLALARVDHWIKNIFMAPGIVVAFVIAGTPAAGVATRIILGVLSTCLVASANYVINEWLDRDFDRHHPLKKVRPAVVADMRGAFVALEYGLLVAAGVLVAAAVSRPFAAISLLLLLMGIVYNVAPFRTKDRPYLDVLSESINSPLRFLLGWFTVVSGAMPPSSVLLAYWMGGAFLMAVKRFSEFRYIADPVLAGRYRRSFRFYTEDTLLISSFFYALCAVFFLGIFLIKYRIELVVSFPFFSLLFAWYLAIGLRPYSATQAPEKLYEEPLFLAYVGFLVSFVAVLLFVDMPWLGILVRRLSY